MAVAVGTVVVRDDPAMITAAKAADSGVPTAVPVVPVAASGAVPTAAPVAAVDRDARLMVPARCIRQPVQIAERNVKFRSGLLKEDLCTATIASRSTENPDTNSH